ncbi:uncharacterized protein LOC6534516 isoform X1 [Drosophila yakuba]|uniref:Uncharacterized protein, isoform A n=2 Tax=Drosophila yakuba TaxID=7245 RepID=B4PCJ5_DROYA|nr:uncharacterized protein LOC6534516 isoform X1 [Drosophila yakuba]XP_043063012.1 uncharacterized protein LOC6534516 isoform X1 [Drosophila yakuba]XP_043063013.1 uncharacterized protein LOC6534516 isoform X1 [Drosophila yakuba]EDW94905.1 uncharacterized protein Dyak_GE19827, isoform A [Drosophila yakuba]KRK02112.1 uncharacterized protein Dyak_GE19827, isoform B [Drosophila yakuba]
MADLLKALNITGNLLAGLEDTSNLTIATATTTTLSEGLNGNATTLDAAASTNSGEKLDLGGFDLPGNYSILINKLEQLALGLDSALGNFTIDRQEVEINLSGAASANEVADVADDLFDVLPAARAPPPHIAHGSRIYTGDDGQDFAHVVSDIWIGVILTLLIVFVIFFICACFVYHKFQQWKNSYRANHSDPTIEICRRCPPDYEAESLPSYTIVSGLPTYDDALEEFRKAGIILTPAVVPIIKIFECTETGKEQAVGYSLVETNMANADAAADNVSLASTTCNCGNSSPTSSLPSYSAATAAAMAAAAAAPPQVIELSPEHLASLSQKRLSLQISFNNSVRRQSPLRNHLLRSRAVGNTAGVGPSEAAGPAIHGSGAHGVRGGGNATILPVLHRSSSTISLSNERQLLDQRLRHLHHRGSLY